MRRRLKIISINQTIKSTTRLVLQQVERKLKIENLTGKETQWRGRKIISIQKWEKLTKKRDSPFELLKFIPEDYMEHPIPLFFRDEKFLDKTPEWYKDYWDYLVYKKSPGLGEYECRGCILHTWDSHQNPSLRKVILKGQDKKYEFPCPVQNIFECPHGQELENPKVNLFGLREMWVKVSESLRFGHNLDTFHDYFHEVDFEKQLVTTCNGIRNPDCDLRTQLKHFEGERFSKIPVQSVHDIYEIITTPKLLDIILEQFINPGKKDGEKDDENSPDESRLRKMKKPIIDYFISLKKKIKIEELVNCEDKNLEQEKEDQKRHEESEKNWELSLPDQYVPLEKRSGKCINCGIFSNIHCLNCGDWLCVDHWKEHGIEIHNIKIPIN